MAAQHQVSMRCLNATAADLLRYAVPQPYGKGDSVVVSGDQVTIWYTDNTAAYAHEVVKRAVEYLLVDPRVGNDVESEISGDSAVRR